MYLARRHDGHSVGSHDRGFVRFCDADTDVALRLLSAQSMDQSGPLERRSRASTGRGTCVHLQLRGRRALPGMRHVHLRLFRVEGTRMQMLARGFHIPQVPGLLRLRSLRTRIQTARKHLTLKPIMMTSSTGKTAGMTENKNRLI
jgi:hypothetical protein